MIDSIIGHGQNHDAAGRLHARNGAHFLEVVAIKLGPLVLLVLRIGQFEEERQQMVGIEALIGVQQVHEAGDEQPGSGGQHQAQRDLRHDERGAQPVAMRGFRASTLFEGADQVGLRSGDGRDDPEDQSRDERQQDGEAEHAQVNAGIGRAGNTVADERQHRRRGRERQSRIPPGRQPCSGQGSRPAVGG